MPKWPKISRHHLWHTLTAHSGLVILILFLTITTLTNLPQPNHWLMGWDNFSVSLDLPLNFSRTVLATWREYRGFGVPSDSEVVDVFRQLPLLVLNLVLPSWTLEWVYYFGMYWLGALGAFYLTNAVVKNIAPFRAHRQALQIASLIGALAYATNLYTLDVFYFPITLYVVRHGLLPWVLWSAFQLLTQAQPSPRLWLWFALLVLAASPGALTATVFFVTALIIGVMLLSFGNLKRKLQVGTLLIALQIFWLLPFGNYFLQKSGIIPKASTFVPINEMLLNQPFERFTFDRLLTFSTDFTSGAPFKDLSGKPIEVHPGLNYTPIGKLPPLPYWSIWLPTLLGVITLLIWQKQQRNWRHSWLLLLLLIGIFLLRKEYPPAGGLFEWLSAHIPVLKVVLRFGGTKLNPLLILSSSILSGLAAAGAWELISATKSKQMQSTFHLATNALMIVAVGWMGWFALSGSLYFRVMSTAIPEGIFAAAKQINAEPDYGRVLQLPYGIHSYWRSHSYGYYGSSFWAFLLDKPLQDKTFSPGNLDHNAYDETLTKLIANTSQLTSESQAMRAKEFAAFLSRTNTIYILWDPTVSNHIRTQELTTWELLPIADTNSLLQALLDHRLATVIGEYDLPEWAQPTPDAHTTLKVLKLYSTQPIVTSPDSAVALDISTTQVFTPTLNAVPNPLIQSSDLRGRIYPWSDPLTFLHTTSTGLQLGNTSSANQPWHLNLTALQSPSENEYVGVDIFATFAKGQLSVYFRPTPLPFSPEYAPTHPPQFTAPISNEEWNSTDIAFNYNQYLNNWHVLGEHQTNQFRLVVNDQVLPLPSNLSAQTTYLSSVLLPIRDLDQLPISLLVADQIGEGENRNFSGNYFTLTPDPNCWLDKYADFSSTFGSNDASVTATTSHGTLCFGASLDLAEVSDLKASNPDKRRYFELEFVPEIFNEQPELVQTDFPLPEQQNLQAKQIAQPMISELFVCLMSTPTGECLNKQRFLKSTAPNPVRIGTHRLFTENKLHILITLPTFGTEKQHVKIDQLKLIGFTSRFSTYAKLYSEQYKVLPAPTTLKTAALTIPYFLSAGSLYTNPKIHGIQVENRGLCQLNQIDRRTSGQQHISATDDRLQVYLDNCATNVSYYLPYLPTNAYWWSVDYQHLAGGQPQFLANTSLLLADELLGLNQGYPFAANNIVPETAKVLIPAQGKTITDPSELFSLTQYTANQSLFEIGSTKIFPLPANWQNAYLETADSTHHFAPLTVTNPQKIWPSLWKVELSQPVPATPDPFLVIFNQGYDYQWLLLHDLRPVAASHVKANGWANGWIINQGDLPPTGTYYFFYWPELLNLLGWLITLSTVCVLTAHYLRYRRQPPQAHKKERLTKLVKTALYSHSR